MMEEPISIHAAKTHLSRLIARAEAGEEIVIARGRKPVVKLVPIEAPKPKRVFGSMKGQFTVGPEFFEPMSEEELALWYGDADPS
jgi:prevent-host-death family protein